MRDLIAGLQYPLRGLAWLPRSGIRRYVMVPLLVNLLLFSLAIKLGLQQLAALDQWLQSYLPNWLSWLTGLLWPLFWLSIGLVGFYTFSLVANFIAAPFNSLLAEKVEDLHSFNSVRPPSRPLWQELALSPLNEARKLGYFILRALPLLLLFFIPGLNLMAPFIWGAFGAWLLAQQYMDYPLANHGLDFPQQRQLLRRQRGLCLSFGAGCLVLTLIPVVNFVAMPAAVIGATLLWRERMAESRGS